ncbi:MAG: molybdopterin cofactor-binding domain-containing protein, partial [Beijerinckiaceae bacterium]
NYVAALDAKAKLLEIAASVHGGKAGDYDLKGGKIVSKDGSKSMSYGDAAKKAIEMGGKFSGKELPKNINPMTRAAATAISGTGLMGVAKDTLKKRGMVPGLCAGYCMVEVDTETGDVAIKEYVGVTDCGTILHPMGLQTQMHGGAMMGFGMSVFERIVYDHALGLPANVSLNQAKPPTWLELPEKFEWAAAEKPDRDNPVGVKGMGEPVQGAAASALVSAIEDALGHHFHKTPIVRDMIVNHLAGQKQSYRPLQANTM